MKIANKEELAVGDMSGALLERKPLPIGRKEFMEWSDRIIAGSLVEAEPDSLRFALGAMLMHIGPTEAFKEDAYFILALRKGAVNQTAHAMMQELKAEQEAKQKKTAEDTAPKLRVVDGVLEDQEVPGS